MNNIKIKFDPFQDKCTFTLDGESLPRYSPLNSYVGKSLLASAATLLRDISDELNDDFQLTIVGAAFEARLMADLKTGCSDCQSLTVEEQLDLNQRFQQARLLLGDPADTIKEPVYCQLDLAMDEQLAVRVAAADKATVCVATDLQQAESLAAAHKPQLILYPAQERGVSFTANNTHCLWGVPQEELAGCLQAAVERFAIPRYIRQAEQAQQDGAVKESVQNLAAIDVQVSVSVATEAIEEDKLTPVFTANGKLPVIRMETLNPQVIQIKDGILEAAGAGTATVRFYKDSEIEAFETVTIRVRPNNLLKTIQLSAPAEMKPGKTYRLETAFEPVDSPEISQLRWSVEDPSIVQVEKDGSFRTLKAGTTRITATAERIHASVAVTVLPGMEKILLSKDKITLGIARTEEIALTVQPQGCRADKIICKSTNPKVATAEINELGLWVVKGKGITAGGEGHCQLVFLDEDSGCKAVCDVTVVSSLKITEQKGAFLSRTAIMTLIAFVLQFLPAPLGVYGAMAAGAIAVVLGVVGLKKNPKDAFWQILLMALSAWIIVDIIIKL